MKRFLFTNVSKFLNDPTAKIQGFCSMLDHVHQFIHGFGANAVSFVHDW